jgi:hypothetical protein
MKKEYIDRFTCVTSTNILCRMLLINTGKMRNIISDGMGGNM